MKNEYIYERKGKKGITLQVIVPYGTGNNRSAKSLSVRVYDYPSKSAAYEVARMERDQIMMDIRNNRHLITTPTVGELYEEYWNMSQSSINTRNQYQYVYRSVMEQVAHKKIDEIEAADIQGILSTYASDHSQQMVNKAKYIWHSVYVAAQMRGMNISDKTLMLLPTVSRKPAKKKKRPQVVTYDQFVDFTTDLLTISSDSDEALKRKRDTWYTLWIMYHTGCRPAEVLALNREDIDFNNRVLNIVKSVGSTKSAMRQIVATKRPSSYRQIPISDGLLPILEDLISYSNTSPLICCSDGLPYLIADIDSVISAARDRTGIQFNAYQLRHKFSDDMFANHINPVVIRDLMGHASTSMSLEYAKATPEQMTEAIANSDREK